VGGGIGGQDEKNPKTIPSNHKQEVGLGVWGKGTTNMWGGGGGGGQMVGK